MESVVLKEDSFYRHALASLLFYFYFLLFLTPDLEQQPILLNALV